MLSEGDRVRGGERRRITEGKCRGIMRFVIMRKMT